jgi:hypothetical protein
MDIAFHCNAEGNKQKRQEDRFQSKPQKINKSSKYKTAEHSGMMTT